MNTDFRKMSRLFMTMGILILTVMTINMLLTKGKDLIYNSNAFFSSSSFFLLTTAIISLFITLMGMITINKNPTPITISILGFPKSGKTVYLTVLFNELITTNKLTNMKFFPYGSETIERITEDMGNLSKGYWPSPTLKSSLFMYRVNLMKREVSKLSNKQYKIEVGDFAGEWTDELSKILDAEAEKIASIRDKIINKDINLDSLKQQKERSDLILKQQMKSKIEEELRVSKNNTWLHKTEYFKYVIQSEILLLAIDGELISNNQKEQLIDLESSHLAALQTLLESKNIGMHNKMKMPVAITILKWDLIESSDHNKIKTGLEVLKTHFPRLSGFCERNYANWEVFLVSSVGKVSDGKPTMTTPLSVVDPLIWALDRFTSL